MSFDTNYYYEENRENVGYHVGYYGRNSKAKTEMFCACHSNPEIFNGIQGLYLNGKI